VYLIGPLNHGVRRELRRRLAPHELSFAELTALSGLARRPGLSAAQLARGSLVTSQAMQGIIAHLELRGLVRRQADLAHRRILHTWLTPAGRDMLRRVTPIVEALQAELLRDVPELDRNAMLHALTAALRRLSMVEGSP
jgi:DNA-binding MarR family transcriptional regulator